MDQVSLAIVGLLGVLLGAVLNSVATFALSRHRFAQDSMVKAYSLYLNSLSLVAASPPESSERWKGVAGMIEAKSQIALFGSKDVVEGLSEFSAKHRIVTGQNAKELAGIIEQMRRDCGSSDIPTLANHLHGLLFESGSKE